MLDQYELIEAYLLGKVDRATALAELGAEELDEIEYQRDVAQRDAAWGLQGESEQEQEVPGDEGSRRLGRQGGCD